MAHQLLNHTLNNGFSRLALVHALALANKLKEVFYG